jgi:hypothetical protein
MTRTGSSHRPRAILIERLEGLREALATDERLSPMLVERLACITEMLGTIDFAITPVRDDIAYVRSLIAHAEGLQERLENLPLPLGSLLAERRILRRVAGEPIGEALVSLDRLTDLLSEAALHLEGLPRQPGRPSSPRTFLVNQVAEALEDNGLIADAKPAGPLCKAMTAIFASLPDPAPARVPVVVAKALEKRRRAGD